MEGHRGTLLARAQILGAAVLFSTGATAVKATALSGWQVASLRCGVAAALLLVLLPTARRGWGPGTALVAVAYAATMILYVLSSKLTTAASAIFLQATAPLYVLLLGPWLLGERVRRAELVYMAVMGLGLGAFFADVEEPMATAPDPALGNLLAAVAGVSWGLTILGLRWLEDRSAGAPAAAAAGNLLAFLVGLPLALPLVSVGAADWLAVLYLGAVQIGLAYLLLTAGLRRVSAFEVSLLLLAEPVFAPLWAWIVHGEVPGPWAVVGGAVILAGTVGKTLHAHRTERPLSASRAAGMG